MFSAINGFLNNFPANNLFKKVKEEVKFSRFDKLPLEAKEANKPKLGSHIVPGATQIYKDRQETRISDSGRHKFVKCFILPCGLIVPSHKIPAKKVSVPAEVLPLGKTTVSIRFIATPLKNQDQEPEMSMTMDSGTMVIRHPGKRSSITDGTVTLERTKEGDIIFSDLKEVPSEASLPSNSKRSSVRFKGDAAEQNATGTMILRRVPSGGSILKKTTESLKAFEEEGSANDEPEFMDLRNLLNKEKIASEAAPVEKEKIAPAADQVANQVDKEKIAPVAAKVHTTALQKILGMAWKVVETVALAILFPVRNSFPKLYNSINFWKPNDQVDPKS